MERGRCSIDMGTEEPQPGGRWLCDGCDDGCDGCDGWPQAGAEAPVGGWVLPGMAATAIA